MKKVLTSVITLTLLVVMVLSLSVVNVNAATGLKSTWYQRTDANVDDEASVNFSEWLGAEGNSKNWDSTNEELFKNLTEIGTMTVKDFLIEDRMDFVDNADSLDDIVSFGGEWAPNYVVIKYEGYIMAETTGKYQFFSSYVDNGLVCFVNDQKVFELWGREVWLDDGKPGTETGTEFTLEAFKPVKFVAYYQEEQGGEILTMDVKVDGAEKTFASSKLSFFTETPTEEEINNVKNPPSPTPTTAPPATSVPTSAPKTTAAATTAKASAGTTTGTSTQDDDTEADNTWIYIVIGVAAVAVIAGVIGFVVKKKKK